MTSQKNRRRLRGLSVLLLFTGLALACVARFGNGSDVPRHGWWEQNGPVVPHDGFPGDCSLCHVGDGWHTLRSDFEFDHQAETGVPLPGAHARARCLRCHNDRGPVAAFANRGCAGCHEDLHRGQLGQDCESCHGQLDWIPREQISRHDQTRFPLIGAHAATACWRCHEGAQVGDFSHADVECLGCHALDLARAVDPDHQLLGYTDSCERCHLPLGWSMTSFAHPVTPLTGAHAGLDCSACHVGGVFGGLSSACVSCHQADYDATTNPNHLAIGISLSCELCHSTFTWQGAQFDHTGIVSGCAQCHQADYDATTSPNHLQQGFPTSCENCHDTIAWNNATFDHTGISSGCFACHQSDYSATSNPNHLASGIPTSCEDCHTTMAWNPATFTHTTGITGGDHKSLNCSDCHLNPSNFQIFSCTHCHEHNQSKMDKKHKKISGYVWQSAACFNCHPNGG